ncbi:TPA: LamG domain-containing protein [Candidatus Poribacteria bacterium]|nr:LamG domain-containing protein [Candidatus Poribacteria bacterium]
MKRFVLFGELTLLMFLLIIGARAGDLVIYYSFDSLKDNFVPDMSGNGHDGVINGDVTLADGKSGSAGKFANGGYLDLDGENFPADEVPKDAGTVCAWVNVEETGGHHAIFNARASDATWLVHPELRSDHTFRWLFRAYGGTTIFDVRAGEWKPGEWLHYAGTYSKDAGVGILYINGEEVGRENARVSEPIAGDWGMGARVGKNIDDARPFTGLMDDLCIWSKALTQDEIKALMETGVTSVSPKDSLVTTWGQIKKF